MNRLLTTLLLTACILCSGVSFSQEESENIVESYDVLDIGGTITHGENALEDVNLKLFKANKIIDQAVSKKNGKFKFTLMSGHIYTIELTKQGYYTKRVAVNTKIPTEVDDTYKFLFDLFLDAKEDKVLDKYLIDYPVVLIEYSSKKDEFTFDKDYTKSYSEELEVSKN